MHYGTKDKENKGTTKKQTQQPSCSSHLNKGAENVREQNTKAKENKNCKMIHTPYPPTHTLIKMNYTLPFLSLHLF